MPDDQQLPPDEPLDDFRFARGLAQAGRSHEQIRAELRTRGVDGDLAEQILRGIGQERSSRRKGIKSWVFLLAGTAFLGIAVVDLVARLPSFLLLGLIAGPVALAALPWIGIGFGISGCILVIAGLRR